MSLGTANILIREIFKFLYIIPAIQRLFMDLRPEPQIEIIFELLPFYMLVIGKEHHATYFNWLIQIGYS